MEILKGKQAASYLSLSRKPKRTNLRYRISLDERKMLEDSAKQLGVSMSEAARIHVYRSLQNS